MFKSEYQKNKEAKEAEEKAIQKAEIEIKKKRITTITHKTKKLEAEIKTISQIKENLEAELAAKLKEEIAIIEQKKLQLEAEIAIIAKKK